MLRIHCALLLSLLTTLSSAGPRTIASFDGQWRFLRGDVSGAEQIACADQAWTEVDMPHDWYHVGFVRVEVTDVDGIVVPAATNLLSVTLAGGGVLAAFDNGDVTDHTPFTSPQRKARNGRALIMLRATHTGAPIRLQITSDGLRSASLSLPVVRPSLQ